MICNLCTPLQSFLLLGVIWVLGSKSCHVMLLPGLDQTLEGEK